MKLFTRQAPQAHQAGRAVELEPEAPASVFERQRFGQLDVLSLTKTGLQFAADAVVMSTASAGAPPSSKAGALVLTPWVS